MAGIKIGTGKYETEKNFVPDYVDYVMDKKLEEYDAHMEDKSNPHSVTAAQVGLGSVDNTADLDKPVSKATQSALDTKVDKEDGKGLSSNDYTSAEKEKLAGIEMGANRYVHPDTHGANMIVTSPQRRFTSDAELGGKVDKVEGKGLSSNDYTTAEKNKLAALNPEMQHTHANAAALDAYSEAPIDGKHYARKNGAWAETTKGLPKVAIADIDTVQTVGVYELQNYFEEEMPSGITANQAYTELLIVSDYVYVSDPCTRQTRIGSDGRIMTREFNHMDGMWYDWQEVTHTHNNKAILDAVTAAYTEEEQQRISTLEDWLDALFVDFENLQNDVANNIAPSVHTHPNKAILDQITTLPSGGGLEELTDAQADAYFEATATDMAEGVFLYAAAGRTDKDLLVVSKYTSAEGDIGYTQARYTSDGRVYMRASLLGYDVPSWAAYKPDIHTAIGEKTDTGTAFYFYGSDPYANRYKLARTTDTVKQFNFMEPYNKDVANEIEIYLTVTAADSILWGTNVIFQNGVIPTLEPGWHYRVIAEFHPLADKWAVGVIEDGAVNT